MTYRPIPNGYLPQDYHVHTEASCDCRATMAEMCRSAVQRGIAEIAFTDHFDPKPEDLCYGYYRPERYFAALEAARREFAPQGLTIRAGVELGEYHLFHTDMAPVLAAWPYDFVLGSLHWVGDQIVFDEGYFRANGPHDSFARYFTELERLARFGGFDVLSHPDVVKRVGYGAVGGFDIRQWEDLVRPVWRACIENGIGIEINTSSLRSGVGEVHPGPESLRWYREMGGEILTTGSDSHRPGHVGAGLEVALDVARAAGFTRLASFEGRRIAGWMPI
ncbi:MAG: histidinol-phosphatase HisJ family protein [Chloroflexota bacterium]|jgi:histidinol-phosphatase (PHP family)